MQYKSWLNAIIIFVLLDIAFDYLITHCVIYNCPSGNADRLHHLFQETGDEIPIFGSSRVRYDYIPSEMGVNAFNYGLDAASYETTDAFLQIELAKHKTSPIIIDLSLTGGDGIGDYKTYIPFTSDPRIRALLERTHSMVWRYYLPGIRYFGYYDDYLKELINDRFDLARTVIKGYSYERYWVFNPSEFEEDVRRRMQYVNGYFPDQDQNFRLIQHIKEHPERLFFLVYSPVHSSCFTNFEHFDQFTDFKIKMDSYPNAVVIDDQRLDYPDRWFKDTAHLLPAGAQNFSRTLGLQIKHILWSRHIPISPTQDAKPENVDAQH